MSLLRRRLLLAKKTSGGEDLPPESTTFEFPLYLNTKVIEKTEDFLYRSRDWDDILRQLYVFYDNKTDIHDYILDEVLLNYPVFVDGYRITRARIYSGNIEEIITDNDYGGGYSEIIIGIDGYSELYVECYR